MPRSQWRNPEIREVEGNLSKKSKRSGRQVDAGGASTPQSLVCPLPLLPCTVALDATWEDCAIPQFRNGRHWQKLRGQEEREGSLCIPPTNLCPWPLSSHPSSTATALWGPSDTFLPLSLQPACPKGLLLLLVPKLAPSFLKSPQPYHTSANTPSLNSPATPPDSTLCF